MGVLRPVGIYGHLQGENIQSYKGNGMIMLIVMVLFIIPLIVIILVIILLKTALGYVSYLANMQ